MTRFVLTRLLRALITILAVMTFAFVVLRMSGDPAQVMLGPDVPQEAVDAFRRAWGLDQPLWVQYLAYLQSIFTGNFGVSMRDGARRAAVHAVLRRRARQRLVCPRDRAGRTQSDYAAQRALYRPRGTPRSTN